jgi:hypothetical protein
MRLIQCMSDYFMQCARAPLCIPMHDLRTLFPLLRPARRFPGGVPFIGRYEIDSAVTMFAIVPVDEARHPRTRFAHGREGIAWELPPEVATAALLLGGIRCSVPRARGASVWGHRPRAASRARAAATRGQYRGHPLASALALHGAPFRRRSLRARDVQEGACAKACVLCRGYAG